MKPCWTMPEQPIEKICLNCQALIQEAFCPKCGQSTGVGRITFSETIRAFLSATISFDGPLLRTIRLLFMNPGLVFREFIAGKRKQYYKPVAFFILVSAIYIILRALIGYDPLEGKLEQISDSDAPQTIQRMKGAARFMVKHVNNILFLLVFSIALMLKLFFRNRYNLAEYASIGFYIAGIYVFVGIPLMLLSKYVGWDLSNVQLLLLGLIIFYSAASLFQRYTIGWLLKYLVMSILSLFIYVVFSFGFAMIWVSLS